MPGLADYLPNVSAAAASASPRAFPVLPQDRPVAVSPIGGMIAQANAAGTPRAVPTIAPPVAPALNPRTSPVYRPPVPGAVAAAPTAVGLVAPAAAPVAAPVPNVLAPGALVPLHNSNYASQDARADLYATMQPGDQMVATGPNSFGFSRAPQTVHQVAAPSAPAPHPGPLGPAASASFPAHTQESPDLIMGGHYVSGGGMTNHDLALLSGLLQPRVSPVDTATASVIGIGHKQYEDAVRGGQDPSVAMIPFLKLLHDISTGGGMGYFGDRLNQNQAPAPAAPVK